MGGRRGFGEVVLRCPGSVGRMQEGVPAVSATQVEEAMAVLQQRAEELKVRKGGGEGGRGVEG